MWYRFSKLKWNYDVAVGIDYTYAYVKAVDEASAIKKVNESDAKRKYDKRGLDQIDEVFVIPTDHHSLVIFS